MKRVKGLIIVILMTVAYTASSQTKAFETREMLWLGYFNQTRFTNHSGLWGEGHIRLNDHFVNEVHATLFRIGYIYYINDHTRVTLGYAHQAQYGHDGAPTVPEHRPWQQIQWYEKKNAFNMMQWVRLEQRFRGKVEDNELTDEYNFNFRIRYNMAFSVPLKGKKIEPKIPFLFLNNERTPGLYVHLPATAGREQVHQYKCYQIVHIS